MSGGTNDQCGPDNPDPRPGRYYVTAIDGGCVALASGPYPTHAEALARVEAARRVACDLDPRGCFASWGTSRLRDDEPTRTGALEAHAEKAGGTWR